MPTCKIVIRPENLLLDAVILNHALYLKNEDGSCVPVSEDHQLSALWDELEAETNIAFCLNGKWGFFNRYTGSISIDAIWDYAGDFHDGMTTVCVGCEPLSGQETGFAHPNGGKWGCITADGEVVIPVEYDEIWYVGIPDSRLTVVRNAARYGCVSKEGKEVIPVTFDGMWIYPTGIVVQKNGLYGVLDYYNNELLPISYEQVIPIDSDAFICKIPEHGWSFLFHGNAVFENADTIWCCTTRFMSRKKLTYMLAEKNGRFALACEDGRMFSGFSHTMSGAINLAEILLGQRVRFEKWLDTSAGEAQSLRYQ